ncbi:hypothetical protein SKAU_G00057390 [Synaphobranchus kaupii]|uniref:Uncharacterized protein n=1 Tax=Synaphobranchus kaupii TaxID=118154 RepID=A0A9Q1G596_SYNKA|nr:hypothetical protein SKAU_G00057390 [Synaphobranchus kaupii]
MPLLNNKVANDDNISLSKPVDEVKALVDALCKYTRHKVLYALKESQLRSFLVRDSFPAFRRLQFLPTSVSMCQDVKLIHVTAR